MKNFDETVPYAADTFRTVPVEQLDGRAMRIPVELTDSADFTLARGRILHIIMDDRSFCAWRTK